MASISIHQIKKSFPGSDGKSGSTIKVIDGIDLDVIDGEFVSFFGPNGCIVLWMCHLQEPLRDHI